MAYIEISASKGGYVSQTTQARDFELEKSVAEGLGWRDVKVVAPNGWDNTIKEIRGFEPGTTRLDRFHCLDELQAAWLNKNFTKIMNMITAATAYTTHKERYSKLVEMGSINVADALKLQPFVGYGFYYGGEEVLKINTVKLPSGPRRYILYMRGGIEHEINETWSLNYAKQHDMARSIYSTPIYP